MNLDLTIPEHAYMFGFLQTDGHLQRGPGQKGKLTLELGEQDKHILYDFQKLIPCYSSVIDRTRDTNYKDNYTSCILSICDLSFRNCLNELGIPYGKKSESQGLPIGTYSETDYIRSLIDANGSPCFDSIGRPLISLTTYSDTIANYYKEFIKKVTGTTNNSKRNKRDNIYNICMYTEDAYALIKVLYYPRCLSLKRKYVSALKILNWERPCNWKKRIVSKKWAKDQDAYIMEHTVDESMKYLNRNKQSIMMRLWRLKDVRNKR